MIENGKQNELFAGGRVDRVHLFSGGRAGGERSAGRVRESYSRMVALLHAGNQPRVLVGEYPGGGARQDGSISETFENQGRRTFSIITHNKPKGGSRPCRPFYYEPLPPHADVLTAGTDSMRALNTDMQIRTGTIYSEWYNPGKGRGRGELSCPGCPSKKFRWVAEISVYGKRYRFRSTNYGNVRRWLDMMCQKYPVVECYRPFHAQATTTRSNSICHVQNVGAGRNGRSGSARFNYMKR